VSALGRDPLTAPVRGDVISYRVADTDSVFVVMVVGVGDGGVYVVGTEFHGDEAEEVDFGHPLNEWSNWTGFCEMTVLRRGDA
jgi:hypothetical protein